MIFSDFLRSDIRDSFCISLNSTANVAIIETSQLIWIANQLTGFYMMDNFNV